MLSVSLTKILANRLAPFLDSLISTDQSAFIRGRCIHDNFILVQQTVKVLHRHKVPSLFLKLDISKAFDSVSWPFLLEVLQHLGFGCLGAIWWPICCHHPQLEFY